MLGHLGNPPSGGAGDWCGVVRRQVLEIRVNLVLIGFVAMVWLGLYAQTPARLGDLHDMAQLGALEDESARHPGDPGALVALSSRYVAQGYPALAIAVSGPKPSSKWSGANRVE